MGATAENPLRESQNGLWDRSLKLTLVAGILYLVAAFWGRQLMQGWFGLPTRFTPEGVRVFALSYIGANIAAYLPAALTLVLAWRAPRPNSLRDSWKSEPALLLIGCFLAIALAKLILNNLGYWPFTWRLPEDNARAFATTLVASGRWDALVVWLVFLCLIVPYLEETFFRYALLQMLRRHATTWVSILVSSLVFGVAHLGFVPPTQWQLLDVFWLSSFGVLLASVSIRRSGSITLPVVAHVALNTITALVLLTTIT